MLKAPDAREGVPAKVRLLGDMYTCALSTGMPCELECADCQSNHVAAGELLGSPKIVQSRSDVLLNAMRSVGISQTHDQYMYEWGV